MLSVYIVRNGLTEPRIPLRRRIAVEKNRIPLPDKFFHCLLHTGRRRYAWISNTEIKYLILSDLRLPLFRILK